MNNPHVVSLEYELETDNSTSYKQPPPLEIERESFSMRLENGTLTAELKQHFSSIKDARDEVEEFLRAWEIDTALRYGAGELRFVYKDAVVIDRDPPAPGQPQVFHASAAMVSFSAISATLHVARSKYPEPSERFRVTPDVETMWHRYQGYQAGREPLLSMGYFCFTLLTMRTGNLEKAAQQFFIEKAVLRKLSELTSTRGDATSARKLDHQSKLTPLSASETAWIEAAVKALIRRLGEFAPNQPLPLLKMTDLPQL